MIVIGAKGHAKEVLEILIQDRIDDDVMFFDNVTVPQEKNLFDKYPIIHDLEEIESEFQNNHEFVTGIGGTKARARIVDQFLKLGGTYKSIIASNAIIGSYDTNIGEGSNIMQNVFISNSVIVGKGCLLNQRASVHHDATIGNFCDIGPHSIVLGRVSIGNFVSIGAGAIILPDIVIGDNAQIGAGAVVTRNVEQSAVVIGNPARPFE